MRIKHLLSMILVIGCCLTTAGAAQVTFSDSPRFTRSVSGVGDAVEAPNDLNDPKMLAARWAKLWTEKNLDALTEMYAADAAFLTGQGARISGREAIRALFKTAFDAINPAITVHSIRVERSGTLAYDSGEYTETITPVSGGAKHAGKGNYVMVLKRQRDGRWLITQHVWTDVPAEPTK